MLAQISHQHVATQRIIPLTPRLVIQANQGVNAHHPPTPIHHGPPLLPWETMAVCAMMVGASPPLRMTLISPLDNTSSGMADISFLSSNAANFGSTCNSKPGNPAATTGFNFSATTVNGNAGLLPDVPVVNFSKAKSGAFAPAPVIPIGAWRLITALFAGPPTLCP